MEIDQD